MKNISLILNIILLAAVGHLYYLNMSKPDPQPKEEKKIVPAKSAVEKPVKVAYVNIDTLSEKYTWFVAERKKLEKQLKNAQQKAESRQKDFYQKVAAFQQKVQSGNTPRIELEQEQEALAKEEEAIAKQMNQLSQNIENQTIEANEVLQKNVEDQLKELRNQVGYDYVLGYQKGFPATLMLTNDSLDITAQIVNLLNAVQPDSDKKK